MSTTGDGSTSEHDGRECDELSPVARQHVQRAVDGLVDEFGDTCSRETVEKVMDDSVRQLVGRRGGRRRPADAGAPLYARAPQGDRPRPWAGGRAARRPLRARRHGPGPDGRGAPHAAVRGPGRRSLCREHVRGRRRPGRRRGDGRARRGPQRGVREAALGGGTGGGGCRRDDGPSVGSVQIPEGTRHEDWRIGDPTGAQIDEARRVRDQIDVRVQELLAELEGAPAESSG